LPTRVASFLWFAWIAVLVATTGAVLTWHLEYFKSPGPRFHQMALALVPAVAVFVWIYSVVRKHGAWRYEAVAFAVLVALAVLRYEPAAALVIVGLFLACSAAGRAALRFLGLKLAGPLERITVGFAAGCGLMIFMLFLLGLAGLFYRGIFVAALVLPPVIFWKETRESFSDFRILDLRWRDCDSLMHPMAGVAIGFAFLSAVCTLMVMMVPSILVDPVSLHLPSIEYYALEHALRPVPGINYSFFPQGIETLWTLAYSLAGQPAAQMISALFFLIAMMTLFRLARECGLDPAAALAGVIFAGTIPFLHWSGSVMKNDLALALFEVLALYAFVRWLASRDFRWILLGAFLIAQAFGVKYIALFGSIPLALLYGYAVWRQPRRALAAGIVTAVLIVFGIGWAVRAYVLTGNPVAPSKLSIAKRRIDIRERTVNRSVLRYVEIPWKVTFDGTRFFESPLRSPAGILLFAFCPLLALAGRLRPKTGAQWACVVFTSIYLCYWAYIIVKVRYAIPPFALLAVLMAARMKRFYDAHTGRVVRLSLIAVETYALLIAVMGLMIIEVNAPEIAYFAGRIDKAGYLRAATRTYASVEYLKRSAPGASVYAVENFDRAYGPVPWKFDAVWCEPSICTADAVVSGVKKSGDQYAILPENPAILPEVLDRLGHPERLYRDPYFSVFRVR
jgi:hypothetical protein